MRTIVLVVHAALAAQFTAEEQVNLTLMINVINGWNRIAVGFRSHHPNDRAPKAEPA